jgi:hypothetical protein
MQPLLQPLLQPASPGQSKVIRIGSGSFSNPMDAFPAFPNLQDSAAGFIEIPPFLPQEGDAARLKGHYEHKVRQGESLWKIAARSLEEAGHSHSSNKEIWRQVKSIIESNKARYPSLLKNPNLIHPDTCLDVPRPVDGPNRPDVPLPKPKPVPHPEPAPEPAPKPAPKPDVPPAPDGERADLVARKLADEAHRLEGIRPGQVIPGVPGNLGCATFVSAVLVHSGFDRSIMAANTHDLERHMLTQGFVRVPESERRAGDIVVGYTPGHRHGHTGVVTGRNEMVANSSRAGYAKPGTYEAIIGHFAQRLVYRYVGNADLASAQ